MQFNPSAAKTNYTLWTQFLPAVIYLLAAVSLIAIVRGMGA